jgi:hypothetical protein
MAITPAIVVVLTAPSPTSRMPSLPRVTRPGGRCIAIDDASRAGLTGLFKPRQASDYGGAQALLAGAGFRGVRTLAERQALIFVEGIKPALADTVDAHRQA